MKLIRLFPVLLLLACQPSPKDQTDLSDSSTERSSEEADNSQVFMAQFAEFELNDTEDFTFLDVDGAELHFERCRANNCDFAIELPPEESSEDNQGWGPNPELIGRWFKLEVTQVEEELYIDGPMGRKQVITRFEPIVLSPTEVKVEAVPLKALSLGETITKLPRVKNETDHPIIARINQNILDRFFIEDYSPEQEDLYWSDLTFTSSLSDDFLTIQFKGNYVAARINRHEEALKFSLATGEIQETNFADPAAEIQHGLIWPGDEIGLESVCCWYLPMGGFYVYNSRGEQVARILGSVESEHAPVSGALLTFSNLEDVMLDETSFEEIGYETYALKFHQRKDGMLKVIDKASDYWIKESDLAKEDFKIKTWMHFLIENAGEMLGYYANKGTTLKLMAGPAEQEQALAELSSDLMQIEPTGETEGVWAMVEVSIFKEHPCNGGEAVDFMEGWVQLTTPDGRPKVWFYTRGC